MRARLDDLGDGTARPGYADRRRAAGQRACRCCPRPRSGRSRRPSPIRKARADHKAGRISDDAYEQAMRAEIDRVIALQEDIGLDVLVHGEPERNDMVQYFAERLDGFAATEQGWVQSYGTRYVRPPILHGDVDRPSPITLRLGHLRPVPDRQAGQGHADRPGHDAGLVLRPRRPAAGRHRPPGSPGPARRDRRPGSERDPLHPGRRAGPAGAAPAAPGRSAPGLPGLGGRRVPARHLRRGRHHPDPHAHVLLRVRRDHRCHRRPGRRRDQHRGGPLPHGTARRPARGRVRPRHRPRRLRHPLTAGAGRRRDHRRAAAARCRPSARNSSGSTPTAA